jgi:ribosome-binding factor A
MPKEYNRTDRVAELLQRELATLIQQEVRDPNVGIITVTAVKVASDLSFAKVYITQLDDNKPIEQTLKALNKMTKFLRFRLANTIELRIIPQLRFVYDSSISEGNRLANLINEAVAEDERKHHKDDDKE